MDKAFQEEKRALERTEKKLDAIASGFEDDARELEEELRGYIPVGPEDIDRLGDMRKIKADYEERARKYRSYQPSPYSGRIDFDYDCGDHFEIESAYVGEKWIGEGADTIVHDWRSEVGIRYRSNKLTEFEIDGKACTLVLKRRFVISDAQLRLCKTEYEMGNVSLDGEVVDPFLLTVLQDKRRQKRLTNIIRSIQKNQNDIILLPQNKSFVVQGCAGSGKTMVMLHRLSQLIYNNRNAGMSGVKIITPNKWFDAHIDELCAELELEKIDRYSVDEYYVRLIEKYSADMNVSASVESEKTLPKRLLEELYSIAYANHISEEYHAYWQRFLEYLDENHLRDLCKKKRMLYPDTSMHNVNTVTALTSRVQELADGIKHHADQVHEAKKRLEMLENANTQARKDHDEARERLQLLKAQSTERLRSTLAITNEVLHNTVAELEQQKASLAEWTAMAEEQNALLRDQNEVFHALNEFSKLSDECTWLYESGNAQADEIRKIFARELEAIAEIQKRLANLPTFSFVKRNNLRKELSEAKLDVEAKAQQYVFEKRDQTEAELGVTQRNAKAAAAELEVGRKSTEQLEVQVKKLQDKLNAIAECLLWINRDNASEMNMLSLSARNECAADIAQYEDQIRMQNRILQRIAINTQNCQEAQNEIKQLNKLAFTEDEKAYVEHCRKALRQIRVNAVFQQVVLRNLKASYVTYGETYRKTNYRHKLYLRLLLCSLYYTRLPWPDVFLSIDEAQDISIAEYRLLQKILGTKCAFNLYGDVNQLVYEYKGIGGWEEIEEITHGNVYVLNENYRNTEQITDFCNREFGAEITPIGICGKPVTEMTTEQAVQWAIRIKREKPEYRVAILHRYGVKSIQEKLKWLLSNQEVAWEAVDDRCISVLSAEAAKGLEFDAVVAVVDQMSANEKYIAFTRALELLAVVRDQYAAGFVENQDAEAIEEAEEAI